MHALQVIWPQAIAGTRILVSKAETAQDQQLQSGGADTSLLLFCLPQFSRRYQNVRERRRTPGQVAAVRSSSKLDLTASGRVSRLKGLASGDNPVKGRFIHQQAVNAKTSRIVSGGVDLAKITF